MASIRKQLKARKTALGGMLIFVFLSVFFISLFNMSVNVHGTEPTSDCLFMAQGEVLCGMDMLDHISAWQVAFTTTVPVSSFIVTVLLILTGLTVTFFIQPTSSVPRRIHLSQTLTERLYPSYQRPLQELFSRGILHPKLFS